MQIKKIITLLIVGALLISTGSLKGARFIDTSDSTSFKTQLVDYSDNAYNISLKEIHQHKF
ncbi:hypothetical protein [Crassaminicella profunda]|uniref:hypothetical protein n=1 Tax=Crassaminicella profunda TaxID=1286698 RepID=UPI001CA73402|nr:hypothetical protein [Crassaminicella profunda]QZY55417.1 hypothetical protein K7H06_20875 [Crassaminicella profunda]